MIMHLLSLKITFIPLSHSWLMLIRLAFKPSANNTFSRIEKDFLPIVSIPMILLFHHLQRWPCHLYNLIGLRKDLDLLSCVLSNHYQDTISFYVERGWMRIREFWDILLGTQCLLGPWMLVSYLGTHFKYEIVWKFFFIKHEVLIWPLFIQYVQIRFEMLLWWGWLWKSWYLYW